MIKHQLDPSPTSRWRAIVVLCLLLITIASTFGQVVAWGSNDRGESTVPGILDDQTVIAISAGGGHNLALTSAGKVVAWGWNLGGECDVPDSLETQTVVAIAAGAGHSLALTSNGKVVAWGANPYGECSVPASLNNQTVTAIAAGEGHSLALTSTGKVVAWGYNFWGQCNIPESLESQTVIAIAAGTRHCLALTRNGKVVAWGFNEFGQCNVPASLDDQSITAIAGGCYHSLVLTRNGKVVAWGDKAYGYVPESLNNQTVTAIAAGPFQNLVITRAGKVVGWPYEYVPALLAKRIVTAISPANRHQLVLAKLQPAPGLTLSESTFTGGKSNLVTGTITYGVPLDIYGWVYLSSSDPSVVVPDPIRVTPGVVSTKFTLTTFPVASLTSVKLTVKTYSYADATKDFTLKPQSCTVTVNPSTFEGGTAVTGKVTLGVPSATNTTVKFASNDSHVNFAGATVTIPANQTSANFNIPSTPVTANTNVEITATPGISTLTATKTITLIPVPTLSSFTSSRTIVYGNQKTTLSLKLTSKPGPTGTTVTLDATGTGLTVPSTLFFPAGITSKTFDVYADENATTGSVLITATTGASAIGKAITVNQLKVLGSTLSSTSIKGGTPVNVTVTLNAPVDKDTLMTVASSNPAVASVPATVKVLAGSKTVTYSLTTYPVTARKTVTITASKGGYTSTKTLAVTP